MKIRSLILALAASGSTLTACSVREGRIAIPSDVAAATERLEVSGLGAGRSGGFRLAGTPGRFSRGAERLGILDPLFVRHRGGGSFQLAAAPAGSALGGRCAYRQAQINLGAISVTPRRLTFLCEFERDGRPIDATLVIRDPQGAFGTLHGRSEREGTLLYEGRRMTVRSIHRDEGGGLPTPTALGYSFAAEDEVIGAVDLNGLEKTVFAPRAGLEREAVIAASLALAIFWDPAEVHNDP